MRGAQTVANTHQDHRFWYENYTHNQISFGDVGGVAMANLLSSLRTTPNGTTRHIDIVSHDIYWMAGSISGIGAFDRDAVYGLPRGTMNASTTT
jgi:hypothetical protein